MEKRNLPNSSAVLTLGILSIVTCCCYGIIGLLLGVIALVLVKKDMRLYQENPELYSNYKNLNLGRILSIIGMVLSSIYLIFNIYLYIFVGEQGIKDIQDNLMEKMKYQQEQNE